MSNHEPLVSAILSKHQGDFLRILPKSKINHTSTVNGLAAIHFAVTWSWALEKLVKAGPDLNAVDIYGAVALGNQTSAEILLQADCALFTRDEHSSPPQQLLAMEFSGADSLSRDRMMVMVIRASTSR